MSFNKNNLKIKKNFNKMNKFKNNNQKEKYLVSFNLVQKSLEHQMMANKEIILKNYKMNNKINNKINYKKVNKRKKLNQKNKRNILKVL